MNAYLKNLNKAEFAVTYACTGKCKHCSEGEHGLQSERIEPSVAAEAVEKICSVYGIKTVMAFGGEPLLHPEAVYAVMNAAYQMNVPKRQVITNGYFSKDPQVIRSTAHRLAECGVNDLLLSADAFHQETIPLETVKKFAAEAKKNGIPIRLQPAWLVSHYDDNPYNRKTREILQSFSELQIAENQGNVVFPEGNARIYLAEYFKDVIPENPYKEDPYDVKCISFSPNGDVLNGNVYERDIMDIIKSYKP
jgi:MoaA/NifB/PqqE/SkfB family radical SAM enzyme